MSNTASPPNARVSAAVALLDRGYGGPSTAVFVEMTQQVSSAEREALLTTVVAAGVCWTVTAHWVVADDTSWLG